MNVNSNQEINRAVRHKLGINHHDLCHCPDCEKDYCGKIEVAWELVEKVEKDNGIFRYQTMREGNRGHFAIFGYVLKPLSSFYKYVEANADKSAEAIAMAFLKVP